VSTEIEERIRTFFNSFYNIYRCDYRKFIDLFLNAYERDVQSLTNIEKGLVENLINIIDMLRTVRKDTIHEMKDFIMRYRFNYRHVYVVDCLGLPELYALWCNAVDKKLIPIVKVFINVEATTKAFKEVFESETMGYVAKDVDGIVFRRLDSRLHETFDKLKTREELINLLVARMNYMILSLPIGKEDTMIFADHGYDIERLNSKYIAKHTYIRKLKVALSKLAPVMLLKKVR